MSEPRRLHLRSRDICIASRCRLTRSLDFLRFWLIDDGKVPRL